jgi:hypothetical protein
MAVSELNRLVINYVEIKVRAPQPPGDSVDVVTGTPGGFLAAGTQTTSAGQQAVIWTSQAALTGLCGGSGHAITALAASGDVVTGIASAQAQVGPQFILRRLPAG